MPAQECIWRSESNRAANEEKRWCWVTRSGQVIAKKDCQDTGGRARRAHTCRVQMSLLLVGGVVAGIGVAEVGSIDEGGGSVKGGGVVEGFASGCSMDAAKSRLSMHAACAIVMAARPCVMPPTTHAAPLPCCLARCNTGMHIPCGVLTARQDAATGLCGWD